MATVFIGVGSNIEPEDSIRAALAMLKGRLHVAAVSPFYLTDAIGCPDSPPFYNGVVQVETEIEPKELKFGVLREIEDRLGRVRHADKFAPRTIDLDVLVYDDLTVDEPDLVLPDPYITERAFVAVPLAELAPDLILPGDGRTLREVAESLPREGIQPLEDFTRTLRQELEDEP